MEVGGGLAMPQKYEREIEDILRRMGGALPSESRVERARRWLRRERRRFSGGPRLVDAPRSPYSGSPIDRLPTGLAATPSGLLAVSLGVAFLSFVFQAIQPGVAAGLALLAFLLFFGAIVLSVVLGRRQESPRWRGRFLDGRDDDGSVWAGLSRRWRGWLTRRQHGGPRL
jgi:hypothetical protein